MSAAGLFACAWLVPNHYLPWSAFYSEALATLAGLALAARLLLRPGKWTLPPLSLGLLALVVVSWLQLLGGLLPFAADAWLSSLYLVGAALCCAAGARARAVDPALFSVLAWTMVITSIASVAVGLHQWFGLEWLEVWAVPGQPGFRAVGNIAQPNHLAVFITMGLGAVMYLRWQEDLQPVTAMGVAAFLVLGLALTLSRAPWLVGLVCAIWWAARRASFPALRKPQVLSLAGLVAWYGVATWSAHSLPEPLLLDFGTTGRALADVGSRRILWEQMWVAVGIAPLTGFGWLQGLTAQVVAALVRPGMEYAAFAHNVVLDILIWNGAVLGTVIIVFLAYRFAIACRGADGPIGWFCLVLVSAVAAHSLIEYSYAYAYFLLPTAFAWGALDAQTEGAGIAVSRGLVASWMALFASVFGVVAIDYLPFEEDRRVVQMWVNRIGGDRRPPPPPAPILLDHLGAAARAARTEARAGMSKDQLLELEKVAARFPNIHYLRQLALAYAVNERVDEAKKALRRLAAMHGAVRLAQAREWLETHELSGHPGVRELLGVEGDGRPAARVRHN